MIAEQGRTLWPEAARILAEAETPSGWEQTGLGVPAYRLLADQIGALLAKAVTIDKLAAQAAAGLLEPEAAALTATLARVGGPNAAALPMLIAVLLDRVPEAAEVLPDLQNRSSLGAQATTDDAVDLLLRQLGREGGTESRIATGTVADAGAVAGRLVNLLQHLQNSGGNRRRREQLRMARQRLDARCRARFVSSVQEELLAPLTVSGRPLADVSALETAARGLRVLETEARAVGGGSTYDLLLSKLASAIRDEAM